MTMLSRINRKRYCFYDTSTILYNNQSVENAGVAFVKGANERNKIFKKMNN